MHITISCTLHNIISSLQYIFILLLNIIFLYIFFFEYFTFYILLNYLLIFIFRVYVLNDVWCD